MTKRQSILLSKRKHKWFQTVSINWFERWGSGLTGQEWQHFLWPNRLYSLIPLVFEGFMAQAWGGLMVAGSVQSGPCGGGSWFTQAHLCWSPVLFTGPEPWPNGLRMYLPSAQLKQHTGIQRQTDVTLCATTATLVHNPTRRHTCRSLDIHAHTNTV